MSHYQSLLFVGISHTSKKSRKPGFKIPRVKKSGFGTPTKSNLEANSAYDKDSNPS